MLPVNSAQDDVPFLPRALHASAHHLPQQIRGYRDTWERKSPLGRLLIKVTVGGQEARKQLVSKPAEEEDE